MYKVTYKKQNENKRLTVYAFVEECKSKGYTKYIFNAKNKEYGFKISTNFDDVKSLFYSTYNVLYLGNKNHHIDFHNVLYIESVCDDKCMGASIYKIISTTKHSERRKHDKAKHFVICELIATK